MKAQRRHELQQNVLDAELGKGLTWLREHGTALLLGVVAVVLVLLAVRYAHARSRNMHENLRGRELQLMTMSSQGGGDVNQLLAGWRDLAEQTDDASIAAQAKVELGSLYSRMVSAGNTPAGIQDPAAQAKTWFQRVLSENPQQRDSLAKAHVGLARLAEDAGQFDEARQQYQAVRNDKNLAGYPAYQDADTGLAGLDRLTRPIRLAETAPATQTAPATAPADEAPAQQPAE